MARKLLLGGPLGGLVFFLWLGLSWNTPALHLGQLEGIPQSASTDAWLAGQSLSHDKLYYYPAMQDGEDEAAYSERIAAQPTIGLLNIVPAGQYKINPWIFVKGLLGAMLAALLLSYVVAISAAERSYGQRVLLCSMFGVAAFLTEPFISGAFMFIPSGHVLFQFIDLLVGWTLAGLVIAWATAYRKPIPTKLLEHRT